MLSFIHKSLKTSVIVLLVSILSVNILPDNLYNDFPFEPVVIEPLPYDSVIPKWNTLLTNKAVEYIHLNSIVGPESVAIKGNLVYTGLADGRIVEIDLNNNNKLKTIVKFNKSPECVENDLQRAQQCGRFLQLRFVNETLYAVEASRGLYKIDVKTGTFSLVASKKGHELLFYNSFTFDPKEPNLVYITIPSMKWGLSKIIWSILELEKSGQIIAIDLNTKKQVILFDNLQLVNGLDVDTNRDQLVFTETTLSKLSKVSLVNIRNAFKKTFDGGKAQGLVKKDLVSLMPGFPDNVMIEGDIAYVALPSVRRSGRELVDYLSKFPSIKKTIARLMFSLGKIAELANNHYKHPILHKLVHELKNGHLLYLTAKQECAVLELNLETMDSRILGTEAFSYLSEASTDGKGNMYLGSFRSPFLAKLKKP